jgi:hypothetical protein
MEKFINEVGPIVTILFVVFLVMSQVGMAHKIRKLNRELKRAKDNEYAENRQAYMNLEAKWEAEEATLKAKSEWQKLFLGIQKHMTAKGHDRCWLNDLELYKLVDPQYDKMNMALPCMPEFLHNCCVYWRDSQPPESRKLGG